MLACSSRYDFELGNAFELELRVDRGLWLPCFVWETHGKPKLIEE
jgi:hypothetical protein